MHQPITFSVIPCEFCEDHLPELFPPTRRGRPGNRTRTGIKTGRSRRSSWAQPPPPPNQASGRAQSLAFTPPEARHAPPHPREDLPQPPPPSDPNREHPAYTEGSEISSHSTRYACSICNAEPSLLQSNEYLEPFPESSSTFSNPVHRVLHHPSTVISSMEDIYAFWAKYTTLEELQASPFYVEARIPANPLHAEQWRMNALYPASPCYADDPEAPARTAFVLRGVHPIPSHYLRQMSTPQLLYLERHILEENYDLRRARKNVDVEEGDVEKWSRIEDTVNRMESIFEQRMDEIEDLCSCAPGKPCLNAWERIDRERMASHISGDCCDACA